MKIRITEDAKNILVLSDMPQVRKIMEDLKEDDGLNEYAQMAARLASGTSETFEILKATASIAKNCRVWNAYTEDSKTLDIWLGIYAFNAYYGFYEIGIYLTDIWKIGDHVQNEIVKSQMYIQEYKREGK